jgi:predicted RNase H-like HicB family nuclease
MEQYFETGRTQRGREQMMGLEYAVVIEKASDNYCAYVPDLPGCIATGKTREETFQQISEAIVFHLEGLKEDGLPIPEPESSAAVVRV